MKTNQSKENQHQCLLERLRKGACTTFEIRHELDIVAPAPRIFELRHEQGYNIQTFWNTDTNPGGGRHRIARYSLLAGKYKEEKHA